MTMCIFSGEDAKFETLANHDGIEVTTKHFGKYWITGMAYKVYSQSNKLAELGKFNCLKETINLNREGLIPFWDFSIEDPSPELPNIVPRSIDEVSLRPIDHKNKEAKILDLLSRKLANSINPFVLTYLDIADRYSISIFNKYEYAEWIIHLTKKRFLSLSDEAAGYLTQGNKFGGFEDVITNHNSIKLTVEGWDAARAVQGSANLRSVFIAMAFTDRERQVVSADLRDCIKKTVEKLSWKPLIVDEDEHNDGIMDRVIASIKEARFVIAELTYQKSGVYYEAGYAKGCGLQVIHVVKESDLELCHFDVKHLNLVVWKDLAELETKLTNRIKATIS